MRTSTRRILTAGLLTASLAHARPALAQAPARTERIWFGVSGGFQPAVNTFSDTFDVPLYQELERISTAYPVKGAALIAGSGGVRVWKHLTIGLGVTRTSRRASAAIDARIPHPFFDNQPREVEATARTTRSEVGAHLLIGWMIPLTDRLRVVLTAGPSAVRVRQTFVTGVEVAETYPYDTATFKSATTKDDTAKASGFNAGADLFWMFSRAAGAGGLVQITHARANEPAGTGRTGTVRAGRAQVGAGLRLVF